MQLQGQQDRLEDCHWSVCHVAFPGIMLTPDLATGIAECCCEAVHCYFEFQMVEAAKVDAAERAPPSECRCSTL